MMIFQYSFELHKIV